MLKKIKENKLLTVGIFLIILGVTVFATSLIINQTKSNQETKKIDDYIQDTKDVTPQQVTTASDTSQSEPKSKSTINYSMVVEIPRLELKKGLYDMNSKYNSIDYNIAILPESDMPNITNGTLILASHNGNSVISYFRNLSKLSNGDAVFVYYQGTKYFYTITNYYEAQKTGSIVIKTESNKTSIVLISCKPNTHDMQIVYIGELKGKSEY